VDQLQLTAEALDQWVLALQKRITKTKTDTEYYKTASELLDIVGGTFPLLLQEFGDVLDESSIDTCVYRTITVLSLIKNHTISRKAFEEANEENKKTRLAEIKIMRAKALDEIVFIIRNHDLPNPY
jgi:hypothetical protein